MRDVMEIGALVVVIIAITAGVLNAADTCPDLSDWFRRFGE